MESYPRLSLAHPVIYSLYNYLNQYPSDVTEKAVKELMVAKFSEYILPVPDSKQADILFGATFLDPFVHETLLPEHKPRAEKFLLNKVEKYQKTNSIIQNVPQSGLASSTISQSALSKSSMMLKKFLTKCGDQSCALTAQQEITQMISLSKKTLDFSTFWQNTKMPLLPVQARKYLAVSTAIVPSESAFSISNYILRKNRISLTSKNLKYCMFLKDKLD